jgi:hypothetical protein
MKLSRTVVMIALILMIGVMVCLAVSPKAAVAASALTAVAGMSFAAYHNIGAYIAAVDTGVAFNSVAAGANDNAEKAGVIIDRTLHGNALSASLIIQYVATLTDAKKLNVGYRIEHGDDAALADTADLIKVLPAAGTVLNAPAGGGAASGVTKVDLDLGGAKRYLRVNVTADLSAVGADVAVAAEVLAMGGEQVLPAV